jgi:hypothetical protein
MSKLTVVKTKKPEFTPSVWGDLRYPDQMTNTPEGRMPVEIYLRDHKVIAKVTYKQTKEKIIKSAPPRFIEETTVVDYGVIFDNKFEIKGVKHKIWIGISNDCEQIERFVRPKPIKFPKLINDKTKDDEQQDE